jgi:hypothetical protein
VPVLPLLCRLFTFVAAFALVVVAMLMRCLVGVEFLQIG